MTYRNNCILFIIIFIFIFNVCNGYCADPVWGTGNVLKIKVKSQDSIEDLKKVKLERIGTIPSPSLIQSPTAVEEIITSGLEKFIKYKFNVSTNIADEGKKENVKLKVTGKPNDLKNAVLDHDPTQVYETEVLIDNYLPFAQQISDTQ